LRCRSPLSFGKRVFSETRMSLASSSSCSRRSRRLRFSSCRHLIGTSVWSATRRGLVLAPFYTRVWGQWLSSASLSLLGM
jgi:hypothetical protein